MKLRLINLLSVMMILSAVLFQGTCTGGEIKHIKTSYGEQQSASGKILVAYASLAGSTAEVADFIGRILSDNGAVVDVKPLKEVGDPAGYSAVVLGSAIRRGKVLQEVMDFIKANKPKLENIPVSYFIVCMTLKEKSEENYKKADAYLDPLRAEIKPVDSGLFGGKVDFSKLDFMEEMIIKYFIKESEGDYRDWDAIKTWAIELLPKLRQAEKNN
ncbi:MAG: flavodoxin domain-containing protein [Spirochaetes bacterium]|nr:flavodoxin domain-containing protein [Spirochaetota bacterium]